LSERIRVAIVITRLDLGGAQEVALETAARLDPARFDVVLLAGPGGYLDAEAKRRLGPRFVEVPSLVHPLKPLQDLAALAWLWAFFRRGGFQVVHTHSSKAGLLGRVAALLAGVPRRLHTVHGWSFNDFQAALPFGVFAALERWMARLGGRLVVVAVSLREKGLLQRIGRPDQYVLLRAAVDREAWSGTPRSRAALKRLLPKLRPKVVGVVANLKPQKAPLDFVRIAAAVAAKHRDADFVYVGDGPLRAQAEALSLALGLKGRMHFLGWQRDPRRLAAGMDVFLLPSLFEGLPCVFPQALSLGLPVVASGVDGAAEIVKEGVNGYLCQPGDVDAMADRVGALLGDSALRRRLGAAARRSVGPDFGFHAMVRRSQELYAGEVKA
jgi:glycosyltransferase involved in cell wall biosynthesis